MINNLLDPEKKSSPEDLAPDDKDTEPDLSPQIDADDDEINQPYSNERRQILGDLARQRIKDQAEKIRQKRLALFNKTGLATSDKAVAGMAKAGSRSARAGAQAGKQAAKAVAQATKAAGRAVAMGIRSVATATIGFWGPILLIIVVIIIIVGTIIAIFNLSGGQGGGLARTPSTEEEKYATVTLLALANDPQAKQETIITEAEKLKVKLQNVVKNATAKYGSQSAAITDINEALKILDDVILSSANPIERGKLIEQLNAKLKDMQSKYPELFFTAGTCADLKPFIDNGQFKDHLGINIKLIVNGQMKNQAGEIWPASQDLCRALLIGLKAGFSIETGTFSAKHRKFSKSGYVSRHWCGAAIDINKVNGVQVSNDNKAVGELARLWFDSSGRGEVHIGELIVPSAFNQYAMKNNKKYTWSSGVQSGHQRHIHLAGRVVKQECLQR